jgi:type II secretory pathway component PulF
MNLDEFAFFNRQLAEMLRSGLPLEGALRQLSETLRDGALREELRSFEADLARGTPLAEAVGRRRFPELFVRLVRVGAQGGDLPGLLTLLADYYQRRHSLGARLQAVLVYPALVLAAAIALSLYFLWFHHHVLSRVAEDLLGQLWRPAGTPLLWLPVVWLVALGLTALGLGLWPATRRWLRWRLPAFREAHLAQLAAALHLLLARGGHLDEALALLAELEGSSPAGRELARWRQRLAAGAGRIEEFATPSRTFPRLFLWLVARAGSDLAGGFRRAAELYQQRAQHRIEMLLHAALPVAVLVLGLLILIQVSVSMNVVVQFLHAMMTPLTD